jgi:TonB-dependent starch-binding outer membrane protein SusC
MPKMKIKPGAIHAFIAFMFVLLSSTANAQSKISGTVTDADAKPLRGATVMETGSKKGTVTNESGDFSIAANKGATLLISMVGYESVSVKVGDQSSISVQLKADVSHLSEIVVTGYGTQKRALVTGAVASVNSKTLNAEPVLLVSEALQGRVAGVSVVNNGSPGTAPIVHIRGVSSISYASDPLYVVDGFPAVNITTLDVRDIETVDVLKDASAAAIYGSRATNGVIMITTKKGNRSGKPRVTLDSYFGTSEVTQRLSLMNTEQFKIYAYNYRGSQIPRLLPPWVDKPIYNGATQTYGQTNTDWQDAYFKNGPMTQQNISLAGGNDVSRYYTAFGYMDQKGTAPSVGYQRYNFRVNSDFNISKVFTFGENLYFAYGNQSYDANEQGSRTNLVNVIRFMPHMPVYDPTTQGGYRGVDATLDGGDPTNPVEDATLKNPGSRKVGTLFTTAYIDVNFTSSLKFRSTFGVNYSNGLDYRFAPIFNDSGAIAGSSATQATITNNRNISTTRLFTEQLTFDKTFGGKHHVNAVAVYEYQGNNSSAENMSGNQPSNDLKTLNNASNPSVQTLTYTSALISYVGRVNYDYMGKYLLSAAYRYDGLSVWAPGHKWAGFPSVSVGWRVDQEDFMQDASETISQLKLRAGWGETGLDGTVLGTTPWEVSVASNSAQYPFNNNLTGGPASSIPGLGNTDLNWEKTDMLNIGLDLGFLKNKITVTADYYQRKTNNLILGVPLPPSLGYLTTTVNQNVASMTNNGFELEVGYNGASKDFKWFASFNMAINTNNVNSLAGGVSNIEAGYNADFGNYNITNTAPGHPIQSFYGWEVEGIFQTAADVAKHAKQNAATAPGDFAFKDVNGDGVIDLKDRVFLGSFLPKQTYALNLGGSWKNFDLSVFFYGVNGNKIYNAARVITEGMIRFFNAGTQVLNAWTPSNTNTNIPRAIGGDPNENARMSTRFLEDGSYIRMKNIILSYNIPGSTLQSVTKGVVSSLRIYVSAQNLLTITSYTGYDPEVGNRTPTSVGSTAGSNLTNGIDYAVYPQPKSYNVGLQVSF